MKTDGHNMMRSLPAVDRLLNEATLKDLAAKVPRSMVVQAARDILSQIRSEILAGRVPPTDELSPDKIAEHVASLALSMSTPSLRGAINATGVVLHTGLGRAVLPEAAKRALIEVASGHCSLEVDLETGMRGSRSVHYSGILARLCSAEAALAINNNAAAVLLALNTLATGREVLVSRGQLIEIGGSFRLPDIMARSGARMVEVGTTNRTRLSDYEAALTEETAAILRVHPSNYRVVGFAEEVPIAELAELGRRYGIPVIEDVGSGALVDLTEFGLQGEPVILESIKAGADLVTFSGDKLLGGPQAGLIVGRKDLVDELARNPLARVLRIDKFTVAALESTIRLYSDPETLQETVPTLRFISRSVEDINRAARRLRRSIARIASGNVNADIVDGVSKVGGGSLPGEELPTRLVAVSSDKLSPAEVARAFRTADPPIFGRVEDGRFVLDVRTVEDREIGIIAHAAAQIFGGSLLSSANPSDNSTV